MSVKHWLCVVGMVSWAGSAFAQQKVDERRPMDKDGAVSIQNVAGSVKVVGTSAAELSVSGTLGSGVERLEIEGTPAHMRVVVKPREKTHGGEAELVVKVPAGGHVDVNVVSADVSVADLIGAAEVRSVSGDVSVTGRPKEVRIETVSGKVDVPATTRRVEAKSVSGDVDVQGASGELAATTVSGDVKASGTVFERVNVETVSGSVRFQGELPASGALEVKTMSGDVTLTLPKKMGAELALSSFSGAIEVAGEDARRAAEGRGSLPGLPGRQVRRTLGSGGARVVVNSFSGSVSIVPGP